MGGVAAVSKTESEIVAKFDGIVEFDSLKVADSVEGEAKSKIVLSRSGEIKLLDLETKKLLSSAHVPYGCLLYTSTRK